MRFTRLAVLLLAVALAAPTAALAQRRQRGGRAAQPTATQARGGQLPPIQVTQFTLPNGLNVILHPDRSTPIVAVNVWYHVGSKNETVGRTGFAHLFEHMMFQGSKNFNSDFFSPLQEVGAQINGSTNNDRTNYFEVVPSNFLELALFLEADRMGGLLEAMTEEKLANQRDVVKNEKRQRIDNQPYGVAQAKIAEAMYPPGHPYRWLVIGSLDDLTAASMEDVQNFFRRYYVPNNASLTIAGDFDPAEARRLVEKYFKDIPRGTALQKMPVQIPALNREVRLQEEDRVSLPRMYMSWHTPQRFTADDAALDILASVLASGKGSRLYKTLVYDQQIAQDVSAFQNSREIASSFSVVATAKPGKTLAEIESAVQAELEKIKAAPPTAEEVERAYNEYEAGFVYGIQTVLGKADQLNNYHTYVRRPDYFRQDLARFRAVKPADVQRVARKYLTDKRVVMNVVPRGPQNKGGEPVAAGPRQAAGTVPAQQAAGTAPRTPPGERPAGAQPQTQNEAAQTRPAGSSPQQSASGAEQGTARKPERQRADTSKLPKGGADPNFTLPPVQRRKLSNGLEVLVVEHHELPVVQMNLVVKTGAAADPSDRAGLASMTASLLDEGTRTRTTLDISNQLAAIGASLNTGADWDSSNASLLTLTRHLDRALDIYADVILNPAFPQDELGRLRAQRAAAFKQRRDNPNQIANIVYPALIYGRQHPYGHPLTGDDTSVAGTGVEDVRRFYETYYRPNNAALIVVGDVTPAAIVPKLERAFGRWEQKHVPAVDVTAAPQPRDKATIYIVDRPGSAQSVLTIGHLGVPRSTPDFFPLLVMNRILGGQFMSRVNMNLRENKGYTYGARTSFDYRRGAGLFAASADVQSFSTKESVFEFLKELRGIRGEIPVTAEELEYNKQGIIRGFPGGFETPAQIALGLQNVVVHNLPDDYFNNFIANVRAVTLDDLNRVANRYLDPSKMAILVVGDRRQVEEGLRALEGVGNTVTVLDAEGRAVNANTGGGGGPSGGGSNPRQ